MNTVILCGEEKDGAVTNTLFAFFRSVGVGFLYLASRSLSFTPGNRDTADYLVVDNETIADYRLPSGIVVFRSDMAGSAPEMRFPPQFIAVLEPRNTAAANLLKAQGIHTVTCGLSQRDTVTFSSLTETSAVVSLQREIQSIDGEDILPREVPLAFSRPKPDYPMLAAMSVLLLSGAQLPENGLSLG